MGTKGGGVMSQNVKRRSAKDIYYGIESQTGELKHISEVQRGAACGCVCVSCGKPLQARKGDQRRHHFAHISNYDCMYASEVAVYKALAELLKRERVLELPAITLSFPSWGRDYEVLKAEQSLSLESVTFECEPLQYPPMLTVEAAGSRLRLLIDFGSYYTEDDLEGFVNEAKSEGYSLVLFQFPPIGQAEAFTPDALERCISNLEVSRGWLRSALRDKWIERYQSKAVQPPEWGMGYECPLHVGWYKGKYSARYEDCIYCRYNVAPILPGCRCMAVSGIRTIDDFKENPEELQKRMSELRKENEEYLMRRRSGQRPGFPQKVPANVYQKFSKGGPTDEELRLEEERIKANYDVNSEDRIVDRFGRRWVLCEQCGELMQDKEMSMYGGRKGPNIGVCRKCSHQEADSERK